MWDLHRRGSLHETKWNLERRLSEWRSDEEGSSSLQTKALKPKHDMTKDIADPAKNGRCISISDSPSNHDDQPVTSRSAARSQQNLTSSL